MRVQVAIDLALDRLFTYEVPAALGKKLAVGQLLSVPFGHREARGFALEIEEGVRRETGDESGASRLASRVSGPLKPITAIVDETPFFSPALLKLVKKVSAYTAAPLESVLRAALPAAVLKRNARAKEQLFVEPAGEEAGKPGGPPALTARQRWLVDQVVRLGGGWMRSLCAELKTTPASLRALAGRGLVRIEPRARRRDPLAGRRVLPTRPLQLNDEQAAALKAIVGASSPVLLFGVTGSGKTEVYLQAIAAELAAGRGAIVLVPEIALTPQTVQRFASRFGGQVAVLHSALSDGERYDEWHRIRSGAARVVVGPRSAVWAPVANLGLIVVDEEHEASYKQEESPRYSARDVAVLRGAVEGARVVLGSATPSLESWMNVRRGKYALSEMRRRAGSGTIPPVGLVDMREESASQSGGAIFSRALLDALRLRLDRGEQAILFLNRRGYSRSFACAVCGAVAECPECGVPYTYHQADSCLRCHVCGGWAELPAACPKCGGTSFDCRGIGTQRAEAALAKCFPRARVLRMDADSTSRRHSHDDILSAFRRGEADILVGTQMIAKGLDLPNVTLVGVLNADASLNLPDFRAAERTYQLLSQVAGRAGRAELPGEALIQSYDTSEPTMLAAAAGDFARFAANELKAREEAFLPPFCHLAVIWLRSRDLKLVGAWAEMYAASLGKLGKAGLRVSEAMPSALEKADGWYRWQVVLRAKSVSSIVGAWRWISSVRPPPKALRVFVDVDAVNLL
ncbi:MAG: primosomal protein N' [Kiritimatiellae bacterium]|nr:primosomal protein N' [Kiritimatiellia bacterium]